MDCRFNDIRIAFQYRSNKDLQLSKWIFSAIDSPFITKAGIALSKAVLALGLPVKEIFRKTLFKQFAEVLHSKKQAVLLKPCAGIMYTQYSIMEQSKKIQTSILKKQLPVSSL